MAHRPTSPGWPNASGRAFRHKRQERAANPREALNHKSDVGFSLQRLTLRGCRRKSILIGKAEYKPIYCGFEAASMKLAALFLSLARSSSRRYIMCPAS